MNCNCPEPHFDGMEHWIDCPFWEPQLTQEEIRQVRQRLVGLPGHGGRIVRWLPKLVGR